MSYWKCCFECRLSVAMKEWSWLKMMFRYIIPFKCYSVDIICVKGKYASHHHTVTPGLFSWHQIEQLHGLMVLFAKFWSSISRTWIVQPGIFLFSFFFSLFFYVSHVDTSDMVHFLVFSFFLMTKKKNSLIQRTALIQKLYFHRIINLW